MNHTPANPIKLRTHTIALYTHGPAPSTPTAPVLLFLPGLASSTLVWSAVVRLLPHLRSYSYDRSGYRNSGVSPVPPSAEVAADEVCALLDAAVIANPVIVVGHSWAGVVIAELVACGGAGEGRVKGLVLVDANSEGMLRVLDWRDADLDAVSRGLDPYAAKGLTRENRFTDDEWGAFMQDEGTEKFKEAAAREVVGYAASFETLAEKRISERMPLVGDAPVFVVGGCLSRDWGRLYEEGVKKGNGTEAQREAVRELVRTADEKNEGLMRGFLKWSTRSKFVVARESGHFVQLTQPEVVVEGVEWVLRELEAEV